MADEREPGSVELEPDDFDAVDPAEDEPDSAAGQPGGAQDESQLVVRRAVAHRLARAWISLGCGGMVLFGAYAVFAMQSYVWSGAVTCVTALGSWLVLRGVRVASRPRALLLQTAMQAALPPARIVQ